MWFFVEETCMEKASFFTRRNKTRKRLTVSHAVKHTLIKTTTKQQQQQQQEQRQNMINKSSQQLSLNSN